MKRKYYLWNFDDEKVCSLSENEVRQLKTITNFIGVDKELYLIHFDKTIRVLYEKKGKGNSLECITSLNKPKNGHYVLSKTKPDKIDQPTKAFIYFATLIYRPSGF